MIIKDTVQLDYKDLMLLPRDSELESRKDVIIHTTLFGYYCKYDIENIVPIMSANMGAFGFRFYDAMVAEDCMPVIHKWHTIESLSNYYRLTDTSKMFITVGMNKEDIDKIKKLNTSKINIRIDSPNGHNQQFLDQVSRVRDTFKEDAFIIAGNVVTGDRTQKVIKAGADMAVVGIGAGNQCDTRVKTGVGRPQASAVIECSEAAKDLWAGIIADGGIQSAGDAVKALALGADAVMLGSLLGGAKETDEHLVTRDGQKYKRFYGSASKTAQDKFYKSKDNSYRAEEGITTLLPYTGSLKNTLSDIKGGIRSACTFLGTDSVRGLYERAIFQKVNNQVSRMK